MSRQAARRISPIPITQPTTRSAPAICPGAIDWSNTAQAMNKAITGSTFMMGELPTAPRRGSTVNRIVKALP